MAHLNDIVLLNAARAASRASIPQDETDLDAFFAYFDADAEDNA